MVRPVLMVVDDEPVALRAIEVELGRLPKAVSVTRPVDLRPAPTASWRFNPEAVDL